MIEALYLFGEEGTCHALTFNGEVICEARVTSEDYQTLIPYDSGLKTRDDLIAHGYYHMNDLGFILTIQSMLRYWIEHTH